jgi:hypothetical protein
VTISPPDNSPKKPDHLAAPAWLGVIALIAAMTVMRVIYASVLDLRTDEAYYWTWSKEGALSFLDHPPMIAWIIRFGTAILGDTNLGARFAGILAMLVTQLLLADIVRRVTHDFRAIVLALLMPEAALYYGLLMAKVAPDTALIPFAAAMLWSLVRLNESGDGRWWLAAGLFAGLALLSKFTEIMLLPAVAAFMLVPDWRWRWLSSPCPWLAALIAGAVFSPVLLWNFGHDWASFRFQAVRATADYPFSLRTLSEFFGLQFGLVGFVLLPVVLSGVTLTAWRGYFRREPVAILLSTSVIVPFGYFLWKSLTLRVGDTWPMFLWPAGFAATAINIAMLPREGAGRVDDPVDHPMGTHRGDLRHRLRGRRVLLLCRRALESDRPHRSGRRRGRLRAGRRTRAGSIAKDRRELDRHHGLPHLCDAALAFQRPRAGGSNQRARPVSGFPRSRHGPHQGPHRALCRARAGQHAGAVERHPGRAAAARAGRATLARRGDGHLCAGKTQRLDAGIVAAADLPAVPLAGVGDADRTPGYGVGLKHDPEKCEAVFRKDHAQTRS